MKVFEVKAAPDHHTLRHVAGTPLDLAKCRDTRVKFLFSPTSWLEAEEARLALPDAVAHLLEVVER